MTYSSISNCIGYSIYFLIFFKLLLFSSNLFKCIIMYYGIFKNLVLIIALVLVLHSAQLYISSLSSFSDAKNEAKPCFNVWCIYNDISLKGIPDDVLVVHCLHYTTY
jgi:hypothetical protein